MAASSEKKTLPLGELPKMKTPPPLSSFALDPALLKVRKRVGKVEDDVERLRRMQNDMGATPAGDPGWTQKFGAPYGVRASGAAAVDTTWPGHEVVNLSAYSNLTVDVFHLGVLVTLSTAIIADTHYWLEVDLAAAGSGESSADKVASVMSIESGSSFPASSSKLVYPLLVIDAGEGTAYRYCWIQSTGSDTADLRFATVTTPDEAIGTVKIWSPQYNPDTPPLGWTIHEMEDGYPFIAAYTGSGDYDTPGATLGYAWHGKGDEIDENNHDDHQLGHVHDGACIYQGSGSSLTVVRSTDNVNAWDEASAGQRAPDENNAAAHSLSDNRPPATVCVLIERIELP